MKQGRISPIHSIALAVGDFVCELPDRLSQRYGTIERWQRLRRCRVSLPVERWQDGTASFSAPEILQRVGPGQLSLFGVETSLDKKADLQADLDEEFNLRAGKRSGAWVNSRQALLLAIARQAVNPQMEG